MIFDEGHNIVNSILDIYSPKVTRHMVEVSHNQLDHYYQRYFNRLSSQSHSVIIHLLYILKQLLSILSSPSASALLPETKVFSTDGFLKTLKVDNINIYDLVNFITSKRIIYKLNGFVDREAASASASASASSNKDLISYFPYVLTFITALTASKEDSRVIVTKETEGSFLQLLFLNPGTHFKDIVNECRSVVIAGGTLQPVCSY